MKMRHWTYIGLALIVANACLLGGLRAAELVQNPLVYREPSFNFLRLRLQAPWHKPAKLAAPATIRLFTGQRIKSIWLKNSSGCVFAVVVVQSPVRADIRDGRLNVMHQKFSEPTAHQP